MADLELKEEEERKAQEEEEWRAWEVEEQRMWEEEERWVQEKEQARLRLASKEEKRWLMELAAQQQREWIAEERGKGSSTQSRKESVGGARYGRRCVYGQGELLIFIFSY